MDSEIVYNQQNKGNVLLVDDDPVAHMVAEAMLIDEGFSIMSANSGRLAIALFQAHAGDISWVMMDVAMPDLNGFEVMNLMRHVDENVPIILMSARHAYANMKPQSFENPIAFIGKPLNIEALRRAMAACL